MILIISDVPFSLPIISDVPFSLPPTNDYTADYFFDLASNRVRKDVDTTGDGIADEQTTYTYDDNDRLLTEVFDLGLDGADKTTTYQYGAANDRTEQTKKSVFDHALGQVVEEIDYTCNLQGRLSQVVVDSDGDGTPDSTSSYEYNDDGIRVSQTVDGQTTDYLIDSNNPTGYAQVLEEHVGSTGAVKKTYTIGLDVIAQQSPDVQTGNTLYLLADGHGSTRALIDAQLALVQKYLYDAYGNMLPGSGLTVEPANAFTSLLYSGEQTDITGLQYLRARYYNPASGRFNRLDPFAGNIQDPLSLHKYLYAHGDPIGLIDPSGEFGVLIVFSALFLVLVGYNYANAPGPGDPTFPNRDGVLEELPYEVAGLGVGHFVLRPVLGFVGRRVFAGSVHTVTGRLSAVFGDYWKIGGGISKEEAETVVKRFGFDLGPASKLQGSRFKNYKHSGGAVLISPADMRAGEIPRVLLAEEIQHGLDRATQEMTKAGYRGLTNEEFHREIFQRVLKNAESGVFDFLTDEDIQGIRKVIEAL